MVDYIQKYIEEPEAAFKTLRDELAWVQRDNTPRMEYYINSANVPYTYGRGAGIREYQPQPAHSLIEALRNRLYVETGALFHVCFLNRYLDQYNQLGWHADNSPEMDDAKPIAIISLGAEREIHFAPITAEGKPDKTKVDKVLLHSGSLCLMPPGMQDTHMHRIPKAGRIVGERISLTFRGYVKP